MRPAGVNPQVCLPAQGNNNTRLRRSRARCRVGSAGAPPANPKKAGAPVDAQVHCSPHSGVRRVHLLAIGITDNRDGALSARRLSPLDTGQATLAACATEPIPLRNEAVTFPGETELDSGGRARPGSKGGPLARTAHGGVTGCASRRPADVSIALTWGRRLPFGRHGLADAGEGGARIRRPGGARVPNADLMAAIGHTEELLALLGTLA